MRKKVSTLFIILICLVSWGNIALADGKIMEGLSLKSEILAKDVEYAIYLPEDYDTSLRKYPVVYLLHGMGGDDTEWIQFGEINRIVDKAIEDGEIPPMILVMPDAEKNKYYYVNDYQGKARWEDMFNNEFIPFIEAEYRIRAEKTFRAIAGLSMGGYGALLHAMKYPDLYSTCVALSAGIRTDEQILALDREAYNIRYGGPFGMDLEGQARLSDYYRQYDILTMVEKIPAEELSKVRYWLDCGDDDFFTIGVALLHVKMKQQGIPHEYRVRDGSHIWQYWRSGIVDGLKYIGDKFRN